MHTENFYLVGAGGHAKVVFDALLLRGLEGHAVRVTDDAAELNGTNFFGLTVGYPGIVSAMHGCLFHVGIGSCKVREKIFVTLLEMKSRPQTVVHPGASLSRLANIGDGSFLAAKSVVAPAAKVGRCVIINHSAVVDHDCIVGDFTHIAPGATLGGGVTVGRGVLVGAGANILPGISIADNSIIGAGAVVTRDVNEGEVLTGVPAKNRKRS